VILTKEEVGDGQTEQVVADDVAAAGRVGDGTDGERAGQHQHQHDRQHGQAVAEALGAHRRVQHVEEHRAGRRRTS